MSENNIVIREMTIADYDEVYAMWLVTSSRALSFSDEREAIATFLERNSGISTVALLDGEIVGAALGGHDGRRGFIYHMAVKPEYRRRGIGRLVAGRVLDELKNAGILKTHIFVFCDNNLGQSFWTSQGWQRRDELFVFAHSE